MFFCFFAGLVLLFFGMCVRFVCSCLLVLELILLLVIYWFAFVLFFVFVGVVWVFFLVFFFLGGGLFLKNMVSPAILVSLWLNVGSIFVVDFCFWFLLFVVCLFASFSIFPMLFVHVVVFLFRNTRRFLICILFSGFFLFCFFLWTFFLFASI